MREHTFDFHGCLRVETASVILPSPCKHTCTWPLTPPLPPPFTLVHMLECTEESGGGVHNLANAKTWSALGSAGEWLFRWADKAEARCAQYPGVKRSRQSPDRMGNRATRSHTRDGHKGTQRVACAYLSSLLGGSSRAGLRFVGHMRAIEQEERASNSEIMKAH